MKQQYSASNYRTLPRRWFQRSADQTPILLRGSPPLRLRSTPHPLLLRLHCREMPPLRLAAAPVGRRRTFKNTRHRRETRAEHNGKVADISAPKTRHAATRRETDERYQRGGNMSKTRTASRQHRTRTPAAARVFNRKAPELLHSCKRTAASN